MAIQSSNPSSASSLRRYSLALIAPFLRPGPMTLGIGDGEMLPLDAARTFVFQGRDTTNQSYLISRRKRALDLTGAITLLVLLIPILLLVAILVRATSRGPVIFKQKRCGINGKSFEIWKFRSMYTAGQVENVVQATRGDPRITPVGRFIRRTSIDELPQLLNVLQGHMSLIGPRPHAMSHDTYFVERIPTYSDRFVARPGLSGLAQVRGARGETPELSDMERRIALDLMYIRNASLGMDVRILAATVKETIFSSTAY